MDNLRHCHGTYHDRPGFDDAQGLVDTDISAGGRAVLDYILANAASDLSAGADFYMEHPMDRDGNQEMAKGTKCINERENEWHCWLVLIVGIGWA